MIVKVLFSGFEAGKSTGCTTGVTSSFFFRPPIFFTTCELLDLPTFEPFFAGLTFFDGDTDDLYSRSIDLHRVALRDRHQHIFTFHNLTKDAVLAIQMRSGTMCDEELRTIRARSRIRHG